MRRSVLVLLVVVGLLLAGCGPAMVPGAAPETPSGETFVVALPRIVLTFDESGRPGLEGFPLEEIAQALNLPLDLSQFSINPFYVNWMTQSNMQHVELRQTGDGLVAFANGQRLPYLQFKDESLAAARPLAPLLGVSEELFDKFSPLIRRLGLSVVAKFPTQAGAAEIPLAGDDVALAPPQPYTGDPSFVVKFEVKYDEQGVPSIMGISARDLEALNMSVPLALDPNMIAQLQAYNVQNLQLSSMPDGIHIFVNGLPTPSIAWDDQMLQNALGVYTQLNPGLPANMAGLIQQFAPLLARGDVRVLLHLPPPPGMAPVPAQMM